ncbi:MAG: choice-of-anchor E domain-containing protein [Colwellia sp.]|nr:choice-of-anchor E domain-containing protein [Colwellia sp.]
MKKLAAILLLCVSTAQAGIITQVESFGTQGASENSSFGLGKLNHDLTLDAFDSTLGTLDKVVVTFKGQIDSVGSVTNNSSDTALSEVRLVLLGAWGVNDHEFDSGKLYSTGSNTIKAGETFNYSYSSGERLHTIEMDPTLFMNDVTFKYKARLSAQSWNMTNSGTAAFINRSSTATWGEINAQYHYTPVPEPISLILLAVAFLVLLRLGSNKHV